MKHRLIYTEGCIGLRRYVTAGSRELREMEAKIKLAVETCEVHRLPENAVYLYMWETIYKAGYAI